MGLFKNEAIAKNSPFRVGPLEGLPDVEEIMKKMNASGTSERSRPSAEARYSPPTAPTAPATQVPKLKPTKNQ